MSLRLIASVDPAFDHMTGVFDDRYFNYQPSIPEPYLTGLSGVGNQFYYVPNEDCYYFWVWKTYKYWPGWQCRRLKFDAGTGELLEDIDGNYWNSHYTGFCSTGLNGNLYAGRNEKLYIYGMNSVLQETGFVTNDWRYTNPDIWQIYRFGTVNDQSHYFIGTGNGYYDVYDYSVPSLIGRLPCVGIVSSMTMEDESRIWTVCNNGLVTKIDYQRMRYEAITALQFTTLVGLLNIIISFDTKRKRLGCMLVYADAPNGACQCKINFYDLVPKAVGLTDPVPLSEIKQGVDVSFDVSLHGDAGEPLGGRLITPSLADPSTGTLLSGMVTTNTTGQAIIRYRPTNSAYTETLQAQVEVE